MSSTQHKQQQQQQQNPPIVSCGGCGEKPKKGVTFKVCSGCGDEAYCCNACQSKAWAEHKGPCKIKRKAKQAKAKAEEAAVAKERGSSSGSGSGSGSGGGSGSGSGSGSGLRDMGSIMAALMLHPPQSKPTRYSGAHLWNACLEDRYEELQTMLQQHGLDLNSADPKDGATCAYVLAEQGNDKCLSLLAKHGADLSMATFEGGAPIYVACQRGRYACVEVLLDNGVNADLRTSDERGDTPAMVASVAGHVKILALLLDRGSDPDLANILGHTPAFFASQVGHLKALELLVKRGADVNKKNANGETPLDYARAFKQRECVDFLILNGATGMDIKYIPTLPNAQKVCAAASFSNLSVRLILHSHDVSFSILLSGTCSKIR
jgi:hypothetical protein